MLYLKSHTLRGCVDWNLFLEITTVDIIVTPYVGVWIETVFPWYRNTTFWSHTLRGCVDWNIIQPTVISCTYCHTLRGCVDWNFWFWQIYRQGPVTPYVGVWIETNWICDKCHRYQVTPYVGVWIETCWISPARRKPPVTPYVGVWIETQGFLAGYYRWNGVTPYVGVWIETSMAQYSAISKMVTPCVGIYGLEHCSLVGQVYGRTVSIRPLMYFSPGFWFCYDWKKHVQARMLIFCLSSFVVSPRWQCIGT